MKNFLLLIGLLATSAFAQAEAPTERHIAYGKINQFLQFVAEAKSAFVIPDTRISLSGSAASYAGLEVRLVSAGKPGEPIAIGTDGRVDLPLLTTAEAANTELVINRDPKQADLDVNIGFTPADKSEYRYRELFLLLEDANHYIELMGGALSWFIPSMDTLVFKFAGPASIQVKGEGVNQRLDSDEKHSIHLEHNPRLLTSDAVISFSQLPIAMHPDD